nr:MAG TPA: hypothetical protein [Caudoviricetes sp.]
MFYLLLYQLLYLLFLLFFAPVLLLFFHCWSFC